MSQTVEMTPETSSLTTKVLSVSRPYDLDNTLPWYSFKHEMANLTVVQKKGNLKVSNSFTGEPFRGWYYTPLFEVCNSYLEPEVGDSEFQKNAFGQDGTPKKSKYVIDAIPISEAKSTQLGFGAAAKETDEYMKWRSSFETVVEEKADKGANIGKPAQKGMIKFTSDISDGKYSVIQKDGTKKFFEKWSGVCYRFEKDNRVQTIHGVYCVDRDVKNFHSFKPLFPDDVGKGDIVSIATSHFIYDMAGNVGVLSRIHAIHRWARWIDYENDFQPEVAPPF